ncbi:MAG: hypothetical protein V5A36_00980, partial [Natronomonas sp.]
YVHRGGAYTTEIRDTDDEIGAIRVNPTSTETVRIDNPRTGKESLAAFLGAIAEETATTVGRATDEETDDGPDTGDTDDRIGSENAIRGLQRALVAVGESAQRAADRAAAGDQANADAALDAVSTRLDRVSDRLAEARETLPDEISRATDRRLDQAQRRTEQAKAAEKL